MKTEKNPKGAGRKPAEHKSKVVGVKIREDWAEEFKEIVINLRDEFVKKKQFGV
jgi:hypothetical protein